MGNGVGKLTICFTGTDVVHRRKDMSVVVSDQPLDDLGHSFCYVRPDQSCNNSSKVHSAEEATTFRSISGAAVSANTSTPLSTSLIDLYSCNTIDKASAFESSTSFASVPLQPLPRSSINSGPLPSGLVPYSGPIERGFLSGPIERGFQSSPLFSGPFEKGSHDQFQRSYSQGGFAYKRRSSKGSLIRVIRRAISRTFVTRGQNAIVAPIIKSVDSLKQHDWIGGSSEKNNELTISSANLSSESSFLDDDESFNQSQNLQWAQGKAGEDRVHVVVSEEHGWVFVGIYDGFNGPDAPDFLLSNLYPAVHKELKGLLWDDKLDSSNSTSSVQSIDAIESHLDDQPQRNVFPKSVDQPESYPSATEDFQMSSRKRKSKNSKVRHRGSGNKWEENQRWWKCEFDRERLELDRRLKEYSNSNGSDSTNHSDVLKALSRGLRKTEESYLDIADQMLDENPELALMGSCVLVMLMKGEDVYVMNVGDSRAVLAQQPEPDLWRQDLERINEETLYDLEVFDAENGSTNPSLMACQLSMDHSTSIEEEVQRIKNEHPDDALTMMNDRVKGSLKVTRAFGAGFLKQVMYQLVVDLIKYKINVDCSNSSWYSIEVDSHGLYQYFTNKEAVSEVELFIQWSPEGDPAQHLVEEVLFRAAKKAGMDFHQLLEIPQGDRRRYHDDVSIIVISLEGRIWRSCV
ncbi:Protein phosphatase 2C [Cynara cardunculus var. scolymus]|uniref:Protein phosphatase 2C n=1 Tax=Cynara cardunculus var. scolymus TaxID=59895 RepID=A0A103Y6V8_CYNCS|nr:Protein phosphatase 2C [Cynara cardunculus var. scolymus]